MSKHNVVILITPIFKYGLSKSECDCTLSLSKMKATNHMQHYSQNNGTLANHIHHMLDEAM